MEKVEAEYTTELTALSTDLGKKIDAAKGLQDGLPKPTTDAGEFVQAMKQKQGAQKLAALKSDVETATSKITQTLDAIQIKKEEADDFVSGG